MENEIMWFCMRVVDKWCGEVLTLTGYSYYNWYSMWWQLLYDDWA